MSTQFGFIVTSMLMSATILTAADAFAAGADDAQAAPAGTNVAARPLGVQVVLPPPAGFNPLTASPTALARYAVPPAPDAIGSPASFARWQKAVAAIQNRKVPILQHTNISNGPAKAIARSEAPDASPNAVANTGSIVGSTSSNWSGTAVYSTTNIFKTSAIIGEFVVPTARQGFGQCTGGWTYSSQWPGIDGWGSSDVMQAGVEADAYCSGSTTSAYYSAWIEWYPFNETRVSSPKITPGDLLFVEVWNTTPTNGYAYFYNYSTHESAEYQLTAPSGTQLVGNSAEWVVERPGINGGLATLTNYIDVAWPHGIAWNYTATHPTNFFQGGKPVVGTLYQITMNDNNGNGISAPTLENRDFLWFRNFGSSL